MTAVVLLSHGSPDLRSAAAARDLALAVGRRAPGLDVTPAFLQHNRPTLTNACLDLRRLGHRTVVVVPMLLSKAFHARVDVPAAVAHAGQRAGVRVVLAEGIGTDPALLPALDRKSSPGPLVLAAAATTDTSARRRLEQFASAWSRQRHTPVIARHVSLTSTAVTEALAQFEDRTGQQARVASFLLYPGLLHDHVVAEADGRHVTSPLYDAPEVADLVLTRARTGLESRAPSTSTTHSPITERNSA